MPVRIPPEVRDPVIHRYDKPDDVGWIGWVASGDDVVGFLDLSGRFHEAEYLTDGQVDRGRNGHDVCFDCGGSLCDCCGRCECYDDAYFDDDVKGNDDVEFDEDDWWKDHG